MKKIIQIIEDEPSLSSPVKSALQKAGYEVFVEANGDQATLAVKAHKPDLVLLDIMLPGKTGWEIIDEIGKDFRVVIMSNLDSPTREIDFKNKGASDYIVKSNISLKDIVARVNKILN